MPYVTEIPDATIDLTAALPVVNLGTNLLLNELSGSTSFANYDVDEDTGPATLQRLDDISLLDSNGDPILSGQYAGTGTLSTAAATIGLPPLAGVTVQLNPINGYYVVGDDNKVYMVTEEPLDASHIGLKITGTILGLPINLLDINISEIASNSLLAPILDDLQAVLDTLIVNLGYNPNGTTTLPGDLIVPCFVAGTRITTALGPVPVERLTPGVLVQTLDSGLRPIRWVGIRKIRIDGTNEKARPIRIRAGALGQNTPQRDLLVSPQHRILLRSAITERMFGMREVLVPAKQLLMLPGVEWVEDVTEVTYCHFMTDRHEVVWSNGAPTETLYAGVQAMKSLGSEARDEIMMLFPELAEYDQPMARDCPPGRRTRKLLQRHCENHMPVLN